MNKYINRKTSFRGPLLPGAASVLNTKRQRQQYRHADMQTGRGLEGELERETDRQSEKRQTVRENTEGTHFAWSMPEDGPSWSCETVCTVSYKSVFE